LMGRSGGKYGRGDAHKKGCDGQARMVIQSHGCLVCHSAEPGAGRVKFGAGHAHNSGNR